MSYNSFQFVVFFAVYLIIYLLMPRRWMKQMVILIGSIIFYLSMGGYNLLAVIIGTSIIVYGASRWIERIYGAYDKEKDGLAPKEQAALFATYKKKTIKVLLLAFLFIIGTLIYTKVGGLLGWSKVDEISQIIPFRTYLVPIGLSYYTFSAVGYLLDIYWKKVTPEHNYIKLLMCMVYFPHIVQGPISRYNKLIKEFDNLPGFSYQRICFGVQRMLWGFFKKLVIADRITQYTSVIYGEPNSYVGVEVALAVFLGVIELYCDFSGCMDIVIGASETMGITLDENFQRPFFSKSAAEFWRRWHITLGTWFKDYIYMPIAMNPHFMKKSMNVRKKFGNRMGQVFSSAIPLLFVWLLTGLWHGTGKNYVVWGLYWGTLIILGTILAPDFKKLRDKLKIAPDSANLRLFQMVRTFLIFGGGRMLTVTGSLGGCLAMVKQILTDFQFSNLFSGAIYEHGIEKHGLMILALAMFLVWLVELLQEKGIHIRESISNQSIAVRWLVFYGLIMVTLYFGIYGVGYSTSGFAYAQF